MNTLNILHFCPAPKKGWTQVVESPVNLRDLNYSFETLKDCLTRRETIILDFYFSGLPEEQENIIVDEAIHWHVELQSEADLFVISPRFSNEPTLPINYHKRGIIFFQNYSGKGVDLVNHSIRLNTNRNKAC